MYKTWILLLTTISLSIKYDDLEPKLSENGQQRIRNEKLQKEKDIKMNFLKEKAATHITALGVKDDIQNLCNNELLMAIGMTDKFYGAFYATSREKKYCMRNDVTCCTYENIDSIKKRFQEGTSSLRRRVDMLEELLTLFRGEAFSNALFKVKADENTQCDYVFEDRDARIKFVAAGNLEYHSDALGSLLTDLEAYIKRQQWFYGDFICTICNPLNNRHITLKPENSRELKVHANTCAEILEIKDFEARIADIFRTFIIPYTNTLLCLDRIKNDGDEWYLAVYEKENKLKNPGVKDKSHLIKKDNCEVELKELTPEEQKYKDEQILSIKKTTSTMSFIHNDEVNTLLNSVKECYRNRFMPNEDGCQKLCHKDLANYDFGFPFYDNIAQVLKTIYGILTEKDIKKFYKKTKNRDFIEVNNDNKFSFYEIKTNNVFEFDWIVENNDGLMIFSEHMNKKFIGPGVGVGVMAAVTGSY